MKYVLMFAGSMEDQESWEKMPEATRVAAYEHVMKWFDEHSKAGRITGGAQLQGPSSSTTVRFRTGKPVVTDGPFIESKVARAGAMRMTGQYQVQAAIAAVHAEARSWADTEWHQIVVLYDALLRLADSPVVRLNRAVALSHFAGREVALGEVNDLAIALGGYHLFHSARAQLLDQLGEPGLAREARLRALDLCLNPAERSLLERKLRGGG